jgi:hypothetical protein
MATPLLAALGDPKLLTSIELLVAPKDIEDDVIKLISKDRNSNPTAVALYSSESSPHMVKRGMSLAKQAKSALGNELGSVILDPLGQGEIEGRSYAVLPYRRPVSSRKLMRYLQRRMLHPGLLLWLKGAAEKTAIAARDENIERDFIRPLEHIKNLKTIGEDIKLAGQRALQRLNSGTWFPRYVLMHNDLWEGNILLKRSFSLNRPGYGFVIIDWPGCIINGYAIYDMVRLARSIRLKKDLFAMEVSRHCELLECDIEDAMGYLLAALGYLGLNLEHFPPEAYGNLTRLCFDYLNPILNR